MLQQHWKNNVRKKKVHLESEKKNTSYASEKSVTTLHQSCQPNPYKCLIVLMTFLNHFIGENKFRPVQNTFKHICNSNWKSRIKINLFQHSTTLPRETTLWRGCLRKMAWQKRKRQKYVINASSITLIFLYTKYTPILPIIYNSLYMQGIVNLPLRVIDLVIEDR